MTDVDIDSEFTMRDIIAICDNSKVPIEILSHIVQCPWLQEMIDESKKDNPEKDDDDPERMEYLELYWIGDKDTYEGKVSTGHQWAFHGMGLAGVIPSDVKQHSSEEEVQKLIDEEWRQAYAIEFSPVNTLMDYVIKIRREMHITDWDKKGDDMGNVVDFCPSITLIEVLYSVFWELSFMGSPKDRDQKTEEIKEAYEAVMDEISLMDTPLSQEEADQLENDGVPCKEKEE
jgi:hypothetical protein